VTALIKSHDRARTTTVRAVGFGGGTQNPERQIDPELAALRAETEGLREKVAQQDAAIAQHGPQRETSYAEGEEAGRRAGRKEADDGREALASRLTASATEALRLFSSEIASLERLAPLLATEALEKVFGHSESRSTLVLDMLRRQLAEIEAQSVVRVEVAAVDFQDSAQLSQATASINPTQLHIRANAELPSGACRIKLTLGSLEVGVDQQWGRLRELLEAQAKPRVTP